MPQGVDTAAIVVLRLGVHFHNFWFESSGNARAKAIALAGHRISCNFVANRKLRFCVRSQFIRLRPALVEATNAGAAGLDEEGIDRFAALLINCEAFVNHLSLPAADLRRPEGVD